ncbi:uncharacterized protein [Taeniopygia guttata]|uniref:uncharacterized protein n=1 Tax=Taeniopygia guttata TaxID=59729 RepID=UPI003BB8C208
MAAQSACRRPPPPLLWGGAGPGAGAGARQPPAPHRTAPHRVGRSAGARRRRAGLRQGGAPELPWSGSDRGVGQSRAEGPWGGEEPRLSALRLGEAGWKGAGCWRDRGLPPPPSSRSITGWDPAPLPPEIALRDGIHGSPFQKCQAPPSSSAASFASRGGTTRKASPARNSDNVWSLSWPAERPADRDSPRRAGNPCPAPHGTSPERGFRVVVVS